MFNTIGFFAAAAPGAMGRTLRGVFAAPVRRQATESARTPAHRASAGWSWSPAAREGRLQHLV